MDKKILCFLKYGVAFIGLVGFLYWVQVPSLETITSMKPIGQVIEVRDCDASKYELNCFVKTTTHQWRTDVTDWPGNNIQKGDELAYRIDDSGTRREQWVCKNGMCRSQSVCWSWMRCWN